jgi:hypothetical protein
MPERAAALSRRRPGLPDPRHELGRHRAARRGLYALRLVHPLQRGAEAGVAAGELLDECAPAAGELAGSGGGRVGARRALALGLGDQLGPLPLGAADRLLAEGLAARVERGELLGRVVPLEHRHPLDRGEEQVGAGAVRAMRAVERGEQPGQAGAQAPGERELGVQALELGGDDRARVGAVAVEQRADLAQREAQPAEGDDPVEPAQIAWGEARASRDVRVKRCSGGTAGSRRSRPTTCQAGAS